MALISHYPLNGTGEDILGNGPTNSLNFSTFQGEVVGGGDILKPTHNDRRLYNIC